MPLWKLILKLYINLDYMYFKWEARNGYIQYGHNDYVYDSLYPPPYNQPYIPWSPYFKKDFNRSKGLGISYTQHWFLPNTGIGMEFSQGRFTFFGSVIAGPPICIAIDDHHLRNPPFRTTGVLTKGFMVWPKLGAALSLSGSADIILSAGYLYIGETRGDTKYEESGKKSIWYKNSEGARFKAVEANLTVKFFLTKS
jgi:hypothetical protein